MLSQMQELVARVAVALPTPWTKKIGRPKACGLYRAVEIACMYLRHKGTEEFLDDVRGISQSTVSRIVTTLVPCRHGGPGGIRARRPASHGVGDGTSVPG